MPKDIIRAESQVLPKYPKILQWPHLLSKSIVNIKTVPHHHVVDIVISGTVFIWVKPSSLFLGLTKSL